MNKATSIGLITLIVLFLAVFIGVVWASIHFLGWYSLIALPALYGAYFAYTEYTGAK